MPVNSRFLLLVFLLAHISADYYLQTDQIARAKRSRKSVLFLHVAVHLILSLAVNYLIFGLLLPLHSLIIAGFHWLIDWGKISQQRKARAVAGGKSGAGRTAFHLYLADQLLHFLVIFACSYIPIRQPPTSPAALLPMVLSDFQLDSFHFLKAALAVLILIKPAGISIRLFLERFQIEEISSEISAGYDYKNRLAGGQVDNPNVLNARRQADGLRNAGTIIGILERIILYILAAHGQFSAIGFVLTAKSITRYDKITKSAQFAEYYLIGTLLSSAMVLVVVEILK